MKLRSLIRCSAKRKRNFLRSEDENTPFYDEPTGELPVVSTTDSRVTITGAEIAEEIAPDAPLIDEQTLLPHWTDAPTGAVPIVVAREAAENDDPWSQIPAPAWREGEADWVAHEDQFDASLLAGDAKTEDARPWEFVVEEEAVAEEEILDEAPRPAPVRAHRTRRTITDNPLAGRAVRSAKAQSNIVKATLTGLAMGIFAIIVFSAGTLPVAVLVLVILAFATAEAYAALRVAGAHPATVLGIGATTLLAISVYNKGQGAIGTITVLLIFFAFIWYMNAKNTIDVLDGIGATVFVYAWIGVFGSYALLLISPISFSDKHGLAYLLGAIILTVTNDTSALFIGRWLGHRPLNRDLSPNKTIEGFVGALVMTLLSGLIILPMISPWSSLHGFEVGLVLSFVIPMGDLFESMVKRTLGVKDLGHILPGMGGILDRVDGLLFALPTMYYLAHILQLR